MPGLYNIPGTYADVQDGGLRISQPVLQPKVTVLGTTDKTTVDVLEPYELTRAADISNFDMVSGAPSEMTRVLNEAFDGGAKRVEAVIISTDTSLTAAERYAALGTAYGLLLNTNIDIIVPCGVNVDTAVGTGTSGEVRNYAWQLAEFCYQSTANNNTAIGVIGVEPPIANATGTPTLAETAAWVTALADYDTSALEGSAFDEYDGITDVLGDGVPDNYAFYATSDRLMPAGNPPSSDGQVVHDAHENPVDIGAYISVVAAHARTYSSVAQRVYPTLGWYHHNGAGAYAGLIASLPARRATTNKIFPMTDPSRNISLSQAGTLHTARFVSVLSKPDGNKVGDGMTGAYNISQYYRSDFVRLSAVRIVHDAINMVRGVADPFIGEPNNAVNRGALEVQIDEGLGAMVKEGSLNDFEFSIYSTPAMTILGQLLIDIKLDIAHEIRDITIRVGLVPPGSLGG